MAMFVNISNHPSSRWSSAQLEAAKKLGGGEVVDIAFPNVPATATTEQVVQMAAELTAQVPDTCTVAMVQGEMTLVLAIVRILQVRGITCVAACSDRRVVEQVQPDGSTVKTAVFEFVQFRPYSNVR